jgi:hypothetical protein
MLTFASITVLIMAGSVWHYATSDHVALDAILWAGSSLAVYRAIRSHMRLMAGELLGMALLFNPLVPLFRPPDNFLVVLMSIVITVISLIALRPLRPLSTPPIYAWQSAH